MTHYSSLPSSCSPPRSAFQWPAPLSPRFQQDGHDTTATNTDTPLKDILEQYQDDADILRHILMAKAEEDKKLAARDMLKTEQARIYLKQLDLEYLREQSRLGRYNDTSILSQRPMVTSLPPPPSATSSTVAAAGTPTSYVYGLAPVQQQVLARLTQSEAHHQQPSSSYEYPPSSPVAYPHSAHPLCPPPDLRNNSNNNNNNNNNNNKTTAPSRYTNHRSTPLTTSRPYRGPPPSINTSTLIQPSTPISPSVGNDDMTAIRQKRTHHSISDQTDDKLSHNKVMEALKAKIQRGGAPNRPDMEKRQRQVPIVTLIDENTSGPGSSSSSATSPLTTPSPRSSAKPILPPIDTSMGRPDQLLPPHPQNSSRPPYDTPSSNIKLESN